LQSDVIYTMRTLVLDLRYAIRSLRQARAFAVVAVLTLALGIGTTAALFTVFDAVLLKPLRFPEAHRLVRITSDLASQGGVDTGLSVPELIDYRDRSDLFENITGIYSINANVTGGSEPERVEGQVVSGSYFQVLRVNAAVGRVFGPADEIPGIAQVVVITNSLSRRRFGGPDASIGQQVRIDNDLFEIIGVLAPEFRHPGRSIVGGAEFFVPTGYAAAPFRAPRRDSYILSGAFARLKPGITVEAAQARLGDFGASLRAEYPAIYPASQGWRPRMVRLQEDLVSGARPALIVLLCAVAAVLLIACVNVANLLVARAPARQREFAIRSALGATRARIVRLIFAESAVLALVGGAVGLLSARVVVSALVALVPANLPRNGDIAVDARVLLFALAVSLLTAMVFGLWPALHLSTVRSGDTLRDSTRSVKTAASRAHVRAALVVIECALALMLLVTAMLFIRSFVRAYGVDPGFVSDRVLAARLWLPQPNDPATGPYYTHEQRLALFHRALDAVRATPGVQQAGWISRLPLVSGRANQPFTIEGRPPETTAQNGAEPSLISPGYFDTMNIRVEQGRDFADTDRPDTTPVTVVSQTFASKYFPGESPLGKRIRPGGPASTAPWLTIVGVVSDVRTVSLELPTVPQLYRCLWQASNLSIAMVARTSGDPATFEASIRAAVRSVDADLPLFAVQPMTSILSSALAERRFAMTLIAVFAAFALVLSAVGIYGVLAFLVEQRTAEIGVRIALGADARQVVKLVLGEGMLLAGLGIGLGLGGAAVIARLVATLLFGINPFDPVSFGGITSLLLVVAVLACYLPARRALRIDPLAALREE